MKANEAERLAPIELMNLWHGYLWRQQQQENMLAGLVTVWIANYAGKISKRTLRLEDIFKDGRFKKRFNDSDRKMYDELFGQGGED